MSINGATEIPIIVDAIVIDPIVEPQPDLSDPGYSMSVRGFDRLLTTQRPAVLAHVRSVRQRNPHSSPAQIIRILERQYLATVTTGGAGVGAASVIPGVGTGISLALTGVETAFFLESSALFAQSVTEVHGIAVTDPDRARTIVMAMMLGTTGADLVRNLAAQVTGRGVPRTAFWGDVIGRSLPQAFVGPIADNMKKTFVKRFARSTGTSAVGRMLPFGIGAVIGGTANNLLGRRVVASSREAFGPAPSVFPPNLEQLKPPRRPLVSYLPPASQMRGSIVKAAVITVTAPKAAVTKAIAARRKD